MCFLAHTWETRNINTDVNVQMRRCAGCFMMWPSSHLLVLPSVIGSEDRAEPFQQPALPAKENSATELVEIADWSPRDCSLFQGENSFSAAAASAAYRKSCPSTAVVN